MARVRSLHAQNRAAETARAGDRCALNLAGPGIEKEAIKRGDVVLDPGLHAPTDRIDAIMRLLPGEKKPIGQWFPVHLHHGASEVGARIVPLKDGPIAPGDEAEVQLVLDRPIAAAAMDRYVVRDVSAQRTLGGGVFLDLRPPARKRRSPERQAQRAALAILDPFASFAALLPAHERMSSRRPSISLSSKRRIQGWLLRASNGACSHPLQLPGSQPVTRKTRTFRAWGAKSCAWRCNRGCRSGRSTPRCRNWPARTKLF